MKNNENCRFCTIVKKCCWFSGNSLGKLILFHYDTEKIDFLKAVEYLEKNKNKRELFNYNIYNLENFEQMIALLRALEYKRKLCEMGKVIQAIISD